MSNRHDAEGKSRFWCLILAFVVLAAAPQTGVSLAQQAPPRPRPQIETSGDEEPARKPEAKRPERGAKRPTARTRPAPRPTPSARRTVTFAADAPGTDILLDGRKLGTTGKDGKLTASISRGRYSVLASRPGSPPKAQPLTIDDQTREVRIALGPSAKTAAGAENDEASEGGVRANRPRNSAPTPQPPAAAKAEAAAPPPKPPPPSAAEIVQGFLAQKQADKVSPAQWQEVLTQSEKELAAAPNNTGARERALFARGQMAYLRGDYSGALVVFHDATRAAPNSALAHYGSGSAFLSNNLLPEAERSFRRALQLNPGLALAQKGLGEALARQGRYQESVAAYQQALTLGYSSAELGPHIARNMARYLMSERRWQPALEQLRLVAAQNSSAAVFIEIGDCHDGLKQKLSASQAYTRAAELDPHSATAYFKLGRVLSDLREYAAARESLERAVVLDPAGTRINLLEARQLTDKAASKLRP